MERIQGVYIGPPKSASTWLYQCFIEHQEIDVSTKTDSTHYFDINYYLGEKYLEKIFENKNSLKTIDMCQDYIRSDKAIKRIHKENPNTKIIMTLREPIERAFSHYWHVKKKNEITGNFNEILTNYDYFSNWLETGFYAKSIESIYSLFPKENVLILFYEDLKKNPEKFIKEIFEFLEVDSSFKPEILNVKVNSAGHKTNLATKSISSVGKILDKLKLRKIFIILKKTKIDKKLQSIFSNKNEYEKGIDPKLRKKLLKITIPEVEKLEKILDKDLSHWKK